MNKESNLPILTNSRLPIEQRRKLNRIKESLKRTGKIVLNSGLAITGLGVAAVGGPIVTTLGAGIAIISATNVGHNIIFKKVNKNSMFVTRKNLKGEMSLFQESTNISTLKKMKGLKPQEKGALMGLEMLVGLQNYKQQFSDKHKKTEISKDGENQLYSPVFKTVTHGINIKTIEALGKLGYLQVDEKMPKNKSILFFEKLQFKQYKEASTAMKAKLSGDKELLKEHQKQMYEIKFRLTDKPLNIEDLYKQYAEIKVTRGDPSIKRIGIILEALKDQKIDVVTNQLGIAEIQYGSEESLAKRITKEMKYEDPNKKFRESQAQEIDDSFQNVQQREVVLQKSNDIRNQADDYSIEDR